jgi:hypothetical protein
MKLKERIALGTVLPFLLLTHVAGCDVEFGGDGGGGGHLTTYSVVSGQINEIDGDSDTEGLTVTLEDEVSDSEYEDVTGASGGFEITGGFCGTSIVTITDAEGEELGAFSIEVLPGSDTDIGGITVSSGSVTFEDDIITEFTGYVTENGCDGNSGTLTVEIDHDCDTVEVLVYVDSSTDVTDGDNDIDCDEIAVGAEIQIDSVMDVGNSVDAFDIEVIDD